MDRALLIDLETKSEVHPQPATKPVPFPLLLTLDKVSKWFQMGSRRVQALREVSMKIHQGEFISISGPSGSGKSTLLHIIGLLSRPNTGAVQFDDGVISSLGEHRASQIRSHRVGFVFQSFHLLNSLSAVENVELPLIYQRVAPQKRREMAYAALESVGMSHRAVHFPRQLSGGESQRVAIARALVSRPSLILADEPTGNLDTRTGFEILELLKTLNRQGVTLVIVTHDQSIAGEARRKIYLEDGRIVRETP